MNIKCLIFSLLIITIFITSCLPKETITNGTDTLKPIASEEIKKWKMPESLKFCLQEYVYGKEGNWVDLADDHCKQLLPDSLECIFGNTQRGTFGVLCDTPEKISAELQKCINDNVVGCGTDFDCNEKGNKFCSFYLESNCTFGPIGVYCLID